jgi:hypothetical protein
MMVSSTHSVCQNYFSFSFLALTLWFLGERVPYNPEFVRDVRENLAKNCSHQESNSGQSYVSYLCQNRFLTEVLLWHCYHGHPLTKAFLTALLHILYNY